MHSRREQASAGRLHRGPLVVVGVVCLLAGLVARQFLYRIAVPSDYSPPGPRQGANAPFIVTPDPVVEKMAELAELSEGDLVYDLGCGDGRIVITAALKSGCRGIGFDIDSQRVAEATENVRVHQVEDRVRILKRDVLTVDLSKADVAMMYLLPWMMNKLLPQFDQMRPGCRIVSHEFWIDGIEPDQIVEVSPGDGQVSRVIYRYTTPLKRNPAMERGKPPRPGDLPSFQADGR